jgi:hypothetical protein
VKKLSTTASEPLLLLIIHRPIDTVLSNHVDAPFPLNCYPGIGPLRPCFAGMRMGI